MNFINNLQKNRLAKLAIVFVIIILFSFLKQFYFMVQPWEIWIKIRLWALQDWYYVQWFYFKLPFVENVKFVDVTMQKIETAVAAASKDLQSVQSNVALSFHMESTKVINLYKIFGTTNLSDIQFKVIDPTIQESVKASTAKFTAEELITKRQEVWLEMEKIIQSKLSPLWIKIDAVNIVNFTFSPDFDRAIEAKVRAEQDALAEKNTLEKIKYQAQQKIETARWESEATLLKAQAEAEAIRIKTEAIKVQWWADYVKLQWIDKRNWVLPATMLWDSPVILDLQNISW